MICNDGFYKFCVETYSKLVEKSRTTQVEFVFEDDQKDSVIVNIDLSLVNKFTDFFDNKKGFSDSNVYTLPFCIYTCKKFINSMHNFFSDFTIGDLDANYFKCCDYFCVDIIPYIKEKLKETIITHKDIINFTQIFDNNPNILMLKEFLNIIYDKYHDKGTIINNSILTTKNSILFLLTRKWKFFGTYIEIINNMKTLEGQLVDIIVKYSSEYGEEESKNQFMELWKYIDPYRLDTQSLISLSNSKFSNCIESDITKVIFYNMSMFGNVYLPYLSNRYMDMSDHLDPNTLSINDSVDVSDCKGIWLTSKVVSKTETHIKIHFIGFKDSYDENISLKDKFRFLPYKTICSGDHKPKGYVNMNYVSSSCSCFYCISYNSFKKTCPCELCLRNYNRFL